MHRPVPYGISYHPPSVCSSSLRLSLVFMYETENDRDMFISASPNRKEIDHPRSCAKMHLTWKIKIEQRNYRNHLHGRNNSSVMRKNDSDGISLIQKQK